MTDKTLPEIDTTILLRDFRERGEIIRQLRDERDRAMAERDELLAALKSVIELPWLDLLDDSHIERCQQAERLVAKLDGGE